MIVAATVEATATATGNNDGDAKQPGVCRASETSSFDFMQCVCNLLASAFHPFAIHSLTRFITFHSHNGMAPYDWREVDARLLHFYSVLFSPFAIKTNAIE